MSRREILMSTAITVQLHAETVGHVEVSTIGDEAVSVTFGDDRSGVRLLGPLIDVQELVVEADRQLSRMRDR
jgi:hypothetical protein